MPPPPLRQVIIVEVDDRELSRLRTDMGRYVGESEQGFGRVGQAAKGSAKEVGLVGGAFQEVATKASRFIKGSVVGILLTLATSLVKATSTAADFQKQMAEVATLVDTSSVSMRRLQDEVLLLAKNSPTALSDLTAALYQTVSAGIDAANAIDLLTVANRAAIAGNTTVETSVDGLTSVLNAFGLEVTEATLVADAFFVGVRNGKTTFEQLSASIGTVAPLAASLRVTYAELIAASAALTTAGFSTTESMTALRATLTGLARGAPQSREEAKRLGLEFSETAIQAKGLQGFLQEVIDKTNGSATSITKLFGSVEALNAVLALGGSQAQTFADNLADMETRAGTTDVAFGKMEAAVSSLWQTIKNRVSVALVNLGTRTLPLVAKALGLVEKALQALDTDTEKILRSIDRIAETQPELALQLRIGTEANEIRQEIQDIQDRLRGQSLEVDLKVKPKTLGLDEFVFPRRFLQILDRVEAIETVDLSGLTGPEDIKELQGYVAALDEAILAQAQLAAQIADVFTPAAAEQRRDIAKIGTALRESQQAIIDRIALIASLTDAETRLGEKEAELARARAGGDLGVPAGKIREAVEAIEKLSRALESQGATGEAVEKRLDALFASFPEEVRTAQPVIEAMGDALKALGVRTAEAGERSKEAAEELKKFVRETEDARKAVALLFLAAEAGRLPGEIEKAFNEVIRLQGSVEQAQKALADGLKIKLDEGAIQESRVQLASLEAEFSRAVAEVKLLIDDTEAEAKLDQFLETRQGKLLIELVALIDTDPVRQQVEFEVKRLQELAQSVQAALELQVIVEAKGTQATKQELLDVAAKVDQANRELLGFVSGLEEKYGVDFPDAVRTGAVDALGQMEKGTKKVKDEAERAGDALSEMAQAGAALARLLDTVFDLGDAFHDVASGILEAVDAAGRLVNALEEVRRARAAAREEGRTASPLEQAGQAAQVSLPLLDLARGLIQAINGLSDSLAGFEVIPPGAELGLLGAAQGLTDAFKARRDAERRQREEMERLRRALADNARDIRRSIRDLIESRVIAPATTREGAELALGLAGQTQLALERRPVDLFDPAAGREAVDRFFDGLEDLVPDLDTDLFRRRFDDLVASGLSVRDAFDRLVGESGGLRDALALVIEEGGRFGQSIRGVIAEAEFLQRFLGADFKQVMEAVVDRLRKLPGVSDELLSAFEELAGLDLTAPEGLARYNEIVEGLARDLAASGVSDLFLGLTPDEAQAIIDFAFSFKPATEAVRSFADVLADADAAVRRFQRFTGSLDPDAALQVWLDSVRQSAGEMDERVAGWLSAIEQFDLATQEGRAAALAWVQSIYENLPEDAIAEFDAVFGTVVDIIEAGGRQLEQAFSEASRDLSRFERFTGITDPNEAVDFFVESLQRGGAELTDAQRGWLAAVQDLDLTTEAGRDAFRQMVRGLVEAGVDLAEIERVLGTPFAILEGIAGGTRDAFRAALDAMDLFRRFIADDVVKGLDQFIVELKGSGLSKAFQNFARRLRSAAADGADAVAALGSQLADALLSGQTQARFGLTEEEAQSFLSLIEQVGRDLGGAARALTDPVGEATSALRFFARFINGDLLAGFRFFLDRLRSQGGALSEAFAAVVEEAGRFDLSTDEGRAELEAFIRRIAQGGAAALGLSQPDFEDFLGTLQDFLTGAQQQFGGEEEGFSRSVQVARLITEIQAAEVIILLNEMVFWLRSLYRFVTGQQDQPFTRVPEDTGRTITGEPPTVRVEPLPLPVEARVLSVDAPDAVPVDTPETAPVDAPDTIPVDAPDPVSVELPRVGPIPVDAPDSIPVDAPDSIPVLVPPPVAAETPARLPDPAPQEAPAPPEGVMPELPAALQAVLGALSGDALRVEVTNLDALARGGDTFNVDVDVQAGHSVDAILREIERATRPKLTRTLSRR